MSDECPTCEVLKEQLAFQQTQNKFLLDKLFPTVIPPAAPTEIPEPVGKTPVPWGRKREILEREDRAEAELRRKRAKAIEDEKKAVANKKKLESAQTTEELEKALEIPTEPEMIEKEEKAANG